MLRSRASPTTARARVAVFACGPPGCSRRCASRTRCESRVVIDDTPFIEPLTQALAGGSSGACCSPTAASPASSPARPTQLDGDGPRRGQRPLPAPAGRLVAAALPALGRGGRARPPRQHRRRRLRPVQARRLRAAADRRAPTRRSASSSASCTLPEGAPRGPRPRRASRTRASTRCAPRPRAGSRSTSAVASASCSTGSSRAWAPAAARRPGADDVLGCLEEGARRHAAARRGLPRERGRRARDGEGARVLGRGRRRPPPRPQRRTSGIAALLRY